MNRLLKIVAITIIFVSFGISQQDDPNVEFERIASAISAIDLLTRENVDIHETIYDYQPQIEYALVWRVRAIRTYLTLSEKDVLKASDINYLNYAATRYKELREKLLLGIAKFAPLTNKNVTLIINDENPTFFYQKSRIRQLFGGKPQEYIQINPNDEAGKTVVKKLKLGLAFALLLYDNYLVAVAPYEEHSKLRFIINEIGIDPEVEGYLRVVSESYTDKKKMARMVRVIELVSKIEQWEADNPYSDLVKNDPDNAYLNLLIYGSPSYADIQEKGSVELESIFALNKYNIFKNEVEDRIRLISLNATHQASKLFGNSAGIIVSRQGKMDQISDGEKTKIISKLQPMDILLEKAPFRLTDHLIPGYWSHVGLWCGNELELRKLGVWDELPAIYDAAKIKYHYSGPSFQELIQTGHLIIEALRPGVQINTLEHFLNIDGLGAIRCDDLTSEKKRSYLLNAFAQIGKNYDFNFDVESKNEIVCSELIYVSIDDMEWDTEKTIGRHTISPDNVAQKIKQDNFSPVLLYLDAQEVTENIDDIFPID
ncbi:MAG: YiiX/YebB-like N1pC/P60 family cysteine hydrolase [Fidelibacterota bacterium]